MAGAESLDDVPTDRFFGLFAAQGEEAFPFSVSGTVEITASAEDSLEGTFSFDATEFAVLGDPDPDTSFDLEGRFNATQVADSSALPQAVRRVSPPGL